MIVSVLIWEDANLKAESSEGSHTSVEGQLPVRETVAAVYGVPPGGGEGNPGGDYSSSQKASASLSGKNEGTNVFAIQYEIIQRKPFGTKTRLKDDPGFPADRSFSGDKTDKSVEKGEETGTETSGHGQPETALETAITANDIQILDEDYEWTETLEEEEIDEVGDRLEDISLTSLEK